MTIQEIAQFISFLEEDSARWICSYEERLARLEQKYNTNQPRVPAGSPGGGQWTSEGGDAAGDEVSGDGSNNTLGGSDEGDNLEAPDPDNPATMLAIAGLAVLTAPEAGIFAALFAGGAAALDEADIAASKFGDAIQSIEDYFGGAPERAFTNDDGDLIMMGNGKKIRFDVEDPHGVEPHFHLEEQDTNGEWIDAGDKHQYPFSKE